MPPSGHPIDWEAHRKIFEDLYMVQDMSLPEVINIMREDYGVEATKKMYKKRIKAWGLFKNINGDEMLTMLRIKEHRRRQGKRIQFYLRGKPVLDSKLRRFATRHGVVLDDEDFGGDVQAALRGITFSTPEPEDRTEITTPTHGNAPHLSPVISDADVTSLDCFVGSPNTDPLQVPRREYPDISWDVPVSSSQSLAGTASPTHQVYAWLEDADHSRLDGDYHFPPLSMGLESGHDVVQASTAQSFPYGQQLEFYQPAERPSNDSLEDPALPFGQAPEFLWNPASFHNTLINSEVTFTGPSPTEGINTNFVARDETAALHYGFSEDHNNTPVSYDEHDSINYGGWYDDNFTWPS